MKQILITGNTVAVKAVAANRVGDIPVYITDHSLLTGEEYTICGYRGKQVRDNIHSSDLIQMFRHFYRNPRKGEVYNAGGGRFSNCSMQEAIALCEEISGKKMKIVYSDVNRRRPYLVHFRPFQIPVALSGVALEIRSANDGGGDIRIHEKQNVKKRNWYS